MTGGTVPRADLLEFFPLSEAVAFFPRPGSRHVALPTLYRWAARGVRGARLQTVRLGQQRCTTEAWVRAFITAMNAGRAEVIGQVGSADREQVRRRQVDAALDAAGL